MPMRGVNRAEPQPAFMSFFWMLTAPTKPLTCFTRFCRVSTAFVQPETAVMGLHVMLSTFPKPLPDFMSLCWMRVMFVEPLEAFTSRRVANSSYQTFTTLHKPLHGSNSTWRISTSLYEPLCEANCTWHLHLLSLYQHLWAFKGHNFTWQILCHASQEVNCARRTSTSLN